MPQAILLTGGNQGNVEHTLGLAREMLGQRVGALVAASSLYRSAPWGDLESDADDFLNQALIIDTPLSPLDLLDATQLIEHELGRVRNPSSGHTYLSRPIDIDILFYDDLVFHNDRLTIPHPLISARRFVLEPLNEIVPDLRHPLTGESVSEMLLKSTADHTQP